MLRFYNGIIKSQQETQNRQNLLRHDLKLYFKLPICKTSTRKV